MAKKTTAIAAPKKSTTSKPKAATKPAAPRPSTTKPKQALLDKAKGHDDPSDVTDWISTLNHPLKHTVEQIRQTILSADRSITEGIKWNSPSFYCNGWFATINVRSKQGLLIVLHRGAQPSAASNAKDADINDPAGLLHWHSSDRASITIPDEAVFKAARASIKSIAKQWATQQKREQP